MTGYTYELVVNVKFLFIASLIISSVCLSNLFHIFFLYLLKSDYIPIDALDSGMCRKDGQ